MKIGVFDSGFGGIDILRYLTEAMPEYDYVYLGDNARTPYGTKSQTVLEQYTKEATEFLFEQNCQLVIFACNTASTLALRIVQQELLPQKYPERNALGVIIPACEEAVKIGSRIGVLATQSSVDSRAFEREIIKLNKGAFVVTQPCPLLVPFVETGEKDRNMIDIALRRYLQPLVKESVEVIILGCTHYGLLTDHIMRILKELGSKAKVVHEGETTAAALKYYLKRHPEYESKLSGGGTVEFFATDNSKRFKDLGSQYFMKEINPHHAKLQEKKRGI